MDRDNDQVKWHDKARATNAVCASFRSKRQQLQHALRSRCADGKATSDVAVNIADLQEGAIDVFAPFDLERDKKKYIVKGSIHHHSIADGRSMVWRCCSRRFIPVSIDGDGN